MENDKECPLERWPASGRGLLGCIVATAVKKGMSEEDAFMFAHDVAHQFETFQKMGGEKDIANLTGISNTQYCMSVAKAATFAISLSNRLHDILRRGKNEP